MYPKKNWQILVAVTLFIVLLGGYYEQFDLETRTMVLPLGIIILAAFIITRLKQLEYETRSYNVMAHTVAVQAFSVVDVNGSERISIASASDNNTVITFYDESHTACAALKLSHDQPLLTLTGKKGSALIVFGEDGRPNFALKDDADNTIWSALENNSNQEKETNHGNGSFPENGSTGT